MRKIVLVFLFLTTYPLLLLAQQYSGLPDSIIHTGFTNKYEAKNQRIKGLKEGKWCEYYNIVIDPNYKPGYDVMAICARPEKTKDTNSFAYYTLTSYKAGKPEGMVRSYSKDGRLDSYTYYKDGKPEGIAKSYYAGGAIESFTKYQNGVIVDTQKTFYESGKLQCETPYLNGKVNGVQRSYDAAGNITEELSYKDNRFNGVARGYYLTGKVEWETPFKNGKRNEVEKTYYEDGQLKSETTYKNGVVGKYTTMHSDVITTP